MLASIVLFMITACTIIFGDSNTVKTEEDVGLIRIQPKAEGSETDKD